MFGCQQGFTLHHTVEGLSFVLTVSTFPKLVLDTDSLLP